MNFNPAVTFRGAFYASMLLCALALSAAIFSASFLPGAGNLVKCDISGQGDMRVRTDTDHSADYASMVGAFGDYHSKLDWGNGGHDFQTSFMVAGASPDGKWRNAYRVAGAGADNKVWFSATKVSGSAEFAGHINCTGEAADGTETFDSLIRLDTREGNASVEGRLLNRSTGKPATMQEVSTVGAFLIEHQVNISKPAITQRGWLEGICDHLLNFPPEMMIIPLPPAPTPEEMGEAQGGE